MISDSPPLDLADLRHGLLRSRWRWLTDPGLDLVVLQQPDLWPKIVLRCAGAIARQGMADDLDPLELLLAWARRVYPPGELAGLESLLAREQLPSGSLVGLVLNRVDAPQRPAAFLALAQMVVARQRRPDFEAALAVLKRWPVTGDAT